MFSNQTAELSIHRPVAAVEAVRGDKVNSKFIVGTSSVRASEDNHLLLLRFHSDANHLGIDATLAHPTGPVEHIRTSPSDPSYVLTTAENTNNNESSTTAAATLWKIPSDVIDRTPTDDDNGGSDGDDDDDDEYYNQDHSRSNNDDTGIGSDNVVAMEERATLQASSNSSSRSKVVDIAWRGNAWDEEPSTTSTMGDVVTLCSDGTLTQWDVSFGSAESTRRCVMDVNNNNESISSSSSSSRWNLPPRMSWDPHHADIIAYSIGDAVHLVDWREAPTDASSSSIISENYNSNYLNGYPHHRYGITDLDYNPNKPNIIVTSGKDGLLKFWDLRKTGSGYYDMSGSDIGGDGDIGGGGTKKKKQRPILVARGGHRHWTTCVSYNPFHDQLVLSAGSDSLVNLWRMSTISSAPLLTFDDEQQQPINNNNNNNTRHGNSMTSFTEGNSTANNDPQQQKSSQQPEGPNVRVSRYEHMDSVNAIAWGAADAWIYMSASFDGKVILNHVPSKEKYKILL
jgi:hypothetical protein